jgi:L-fuculose-phosphate aldolase
VEWPIHTEIYRARPEIQSVAHTYPRYGCVIGATAAPITALTREACYFEGRVARYNVTSNLIATSVLGRGLAEALGPHYAILMHNQGVTFCGRSIAECAVIGVILERVCKEIVALNASGLEWSPAREAEKMQPPVGVIPEHETARFWNYYRRKLARMTSRVSVRHVDRNTRNAFS